MYVNNFNCMFHVNTYASVTKVSIIKEDFMMMMVDGLICQLAPPSCPSRSTFKNFHDYGFLRGGDLGGTGGDGPPPKFEVGGRPMHCSLQYFEKQCCRMCVKV